MTHFAYQNGPFWFLNSVRLNLWEKIDRGKRGLRVFILTLWNDCECAIRFNVEIVMDDCCVAA